jgi:nucleotide-binding universal stress UspA family protein
MIVITTHGFGGLRRAVLGSTTEAILRQATCPVLSVRSR